MKTTLKIIAIVTVIFASSLNGFSNDPKPVVAIKPLDGKNFALYINNIGEEKTRISIKDDKGYTLITESLRNKSSYSRKFNMNNLPEGQYVLELEDNRTIERIPLHIAKASLVLGNDTNVAFKPYLRHKNNVLDVMVLSPEQAAHEITIYNQANNVVFNDLIEKQLTIEKQYDVSALAPGEYNVTVNTQGHEYTYTLPVQ